MMISITACVTYTLLAFALLWLVLILVVLQPSEVPTSTQGSFSDGVLEVGSQVAVNRGVARSVTKYKTKQKEIKLAVAATQPTLVSSSSIANDAVPLSSEWLFIRSVSDYGKPGAELQQTVRLQQQKTEQLQRKQEQLQQQQRVPVKLEVKQPSKPAALKVPKPIDPQPGKPAHELTWPPVNKDGDFAAEDGFDVMPMINIKVPRFYLPSEREDMNKVGSKINGEETIFLMIASYRDFQCRETITSAFMRADHPERLFIGAVDQVVPGDIGCLDIDVPCSQDPTQMICKYRDQISVYKMDAQYATGPVTARHVGDRMYRGQYFVMQMDAHCQFVRHWDRLIIDQWRSTHNEMAVLTSYLTDVQGSFTPEGDSTRDTRPIMCNSDYEGVMPQRYLRHGSQPEDVPVVRDMPQLEPFWAAGFSFSRGHFKMRVPYDAYQPMVFQGEEIAIGIRGFTHGYDFYAPRDSVVFHEYASMSNRRKKVHMFWENTGFAGMGQKSLKRATAVIGMAPDLDPASWDHSELGRYGLGAVRSTELFYKLFLIDVNARKAVPICSFVVPGVLHRDFQPYLRADGLGIDYTYLQDYDTREVLERRPRRDQPYWARKVDKALASGDRAKIAAAVEEARKIGLLDTKPDLKNRVDRVLAALS